MVIIYRNENNSAPCSTIYTWNLKIARLYVAMSKKINFFQVHFKIRHTMTVAI